MDGTAQGASDTSPEADASMFRLWRQASPAQKLRKVFGVGKMVNELVRAELRKRYPDATPREIELRLVARNLDRDDDPRFSLGSRAAGPVIRCAMLIGEIEVALVVGQRLDALGVTWLV